MAPFPQTASLKPFAKLFKYKHVLFKYKKELVLGTLALIATNLLSAQIPWIIKSTVDTLKLQDATHHFNPDILNQNLLTILIISLVMLVIRVVSRQFLLGLGRRMEYDFKHLLYQHL
ncbi:MAG: hypothetical protein K2X66_12535, partial [Cyanobacteria bacterium]|nr:hypothetical protein [Cyanobacteriota bacterium]